MPRIPEQVIITEGELAPFVSGAGEVSRARGLLEQQKTAWDLLRTGYASLQSVRTRTFPFEGFQIKVQFNPGRMTSTSAKVDPHSIRERKCFLCLENLPAAQRGLPCDGEYVVLCNPFPIFPEHFTMPMFAHRPQRILGSFETLLSFSRALGERYTVFYNGPKCGASAPDHLHFQAGERAFLPLDTEYESVKHGPLFGTAALRVYGSGQYLRRFIAFESADARALSRAFSKLHEVLLGNETGAEEPLLNILSFWQQEHWRLVIFPRARHRPSFYFLEGDEKLLISPAAVELGGVCTTPREEDFEKVTREHIVRMFDEVCVSAEEFERVKTQLQRALGA